MRQQIPGLLSNQGEKSINFYFIMVPLRKSIQVWYSKAQILNLLLLAHLVHGFHKLRILRRLRTSDVGSV